MMVEIIDKSTADWDASLARYLAAEAAYNEAADREVEANERFNEGAPGKRPKISDFNEGTIDDRAQAFIAARQAWEKADNEWGISAHRRAKESGLDAIMKQSSEAYDQMWDAKVAMMAVKAPNLEAVAAKMEAFNSDTDELDLIIADVRRLAASGKAG